MRAALTGFFVFWTCLLPLFGQDAATPPPAASPGYQVTGKDNVVNFAEFARPRRMIFYFEADPSEFSAFDRSVLYRSVLMAVGSANRNVILLESPEAEIPPTQQGKEELARQIDSDCWLLVSAVGGMGNIRIQVETFDILKQKTYGAQVIEPGYPLDYRTIQAGFWDGIVKTIKTDYSAVVDTLRVQIQGVPGTRINGLGPQNLTVGADGQLSITLPNPATYSMSAAATGYYPVDRTFYLGYDPVTEALHQVRAARFGVDLEGDGLQFPGARFWYFPVPATLYLRAGLTTYAVGLYLVNSTPSVLQGNPLTLLEAGAGWIFASPGAKVRSYLGADFLTRVAHGGGYFGIDPYAPFGGSLVAGIEYSPQLNFHLFAEYSPAIYYTPDSSAFRLVSFPNGEQIVGFLFLNGYSLDLRRYSVGVRITW